MQISDLIQHLEAITLALNRVIGMAQAMADGHAQARAGDSPHFYSSDPSPDIKKAPPGRGANLEALQLNSSINADDSAVL